MSLTLAIVGRPNVGKSTLFNRLVGKRLALVDDQPGVTRDLREGEGRLGDLRFTVIDTAGLEDATDDSLQGRMRRLTERAVDMADVCLFMIDARVGLTPTDEMFAEILRKRSKHVILAANKAEGSTLRMPVCLRPITWVWVNPCACRASMARDDGPLCPADAAGGCRRGKGRGRRPETDIELDEDGEGETPLITSPPSRCRWLLWGVRMPVNPP